VGGVRNLATGRLARTAPAPWKAKGCRPDVPAATRLLPMTQPMTPITTAMANRPAIKQAAPCRAPRPKRTEASQASPQACRQTTQHRTPKARLARQRAAGAAAARALGAAVGAATLCRHRVCRRHEPAPPHAVTDVGRLLANRTRRRPADVPASCASASQCPATVANTRADDSNFMTVTP